MSRIYPVFVAHKVAKTPEERAELGADMAALQQLFTAKLADAPNIPRLTAGTADWQVRFRGQAGGNYQRWANLVASGRDASGTALYEAFVVPAPAEGRVTVGKVTDQILMAALRSGKPCFLWRRGAARLELIRTLVPLRDAGSWAEFAVVVT